MRGTSGSTLTDPTRTGPRKLREPSASEAARLLLSYGEDYGSGNGYTVVYADGTLSDSGGIQGACSHHGGVGG